MGMPLAQVKNGFLPQLTSSSSINQPTKLNTKKMNATHDFYNTQNFPVILAHSGPWDIYRNNEGYCAAIPSDPNSGHKASHFGELRDVMALVKNNYLKLIE